MMEKSRLKDSSKDLMDFVCLRNRLKEDGYLLIRSFISKEETSLLRNEISQNLWGSSNINFAGANIQDPRNGSNYNKAYSLESVHQFWHKKKIITFFESLFNQDIIMHPKIVLRNSYKNTYTPAHQDWPQVQGSKNTLGVWMALNQVERDGGVLEIAESSHKKGIIEHYPNQKTGGLCLNDKGYNWLSTKMNEGDIIIFSCLVIHRTSRNTRDTVRQSIDTRFQPLKEKISKNSLEPFIQDTWNNIYSTWKDKNLAWYWKNYTLDIGEFDNYFEIANSIQIIKEYNNNNELWKTALRRVTSRAPSPHLKNLAKKILNE